MVSDALRLLLCLLTLALTSCDESNPYRRGFDAGEEEGRRQGYRTGFDAGKAAGLEEGEKVGKDAGYNLGKVVGYAEGTVEIVGQNWQPSAALGLCVGMAALTAFGLFFALRKPVKNVANAIVSGTGALKDRACASHIERRLSKQLERSRADEKASIECKARLLMANTLRRANATLTQERLETAVEAFIRESEIVRELDIQMDVAMQAAQEAHQHISFHPDLLPETRLRLLRQFSSSLPRSGDESPTSTSTQLATDTSN